MLVSVSGQKCADLQGSLICQAENLSLSCYLGWIVVMGKICTLMHKHFISCALLCINSTAIYALYLSLITLDHRIWQEELILVCFLNTFLFLRKKSDTVYQRF